MKKTLLLIFVIIAGLALRFIDISADVSATFKAGNYRGLSSYFADNIELTLPSVEGLYSKSQAEGILKSFFEKNVPKNYISKHDGQSNDGSVYSIGILETNKGSYKIYFFLKKQGGLYKMKELRIEKEIK